MENTIMSTESPSARQIIRDAFANLAGHQQQARDIAKLVSGSVMSCLDYLPNTSYPERRDHSLSPNVFQEWGVAVTAIGESKDKDLVVQLVLERNKIMFRVHSHDQPFLQPDNEDEPLVKSSRDISNALNQQAKEGLHPVAFVLLPLLLEAYGVLEYAELPPIDDEDGGIEFG
jgi:hypothetical protein